MITTEQLVKELADKYGRKRDSLMSILQGVIEKESYLSDVAMVEVAKTLDISTAEVYGTATFYSFLDTVPRGKYVIRICKSITCDMHGKRAIIKTLEDLLKIKVGETTQNKQFSLLESNCLGWCDQGPAMLVNEKPYTALTPEKIRDIIAEYRNK